MDISICITTYKHEKYIKECLESIFSQEFSGSYEIIVCNDNSPDNTEDIINQLITTHPKGNRIKYFKNIPNLGYVKNTLFSFSKASGKYIAILDGDDLWIDHSKIQKQFDFLESHPDFSAVGADSKVVYEDTPTPSHSFTDHPGDELLKDDLTDLKICQTSTFFFRKSILKDDFPTDIISADRCLYLLAGCYGKVKIFPEQMSTYRQFGASISKNVTSEVMKKDFAIIPFIKKYNSDYSQLKLKSYFYYTLMSYSNMISKIDFFKASIGYFFYNVLSKFSFTPTKLYHTIKWSRRTIKQKYQIKKQNNSFV
ncbi:glycosyltransferase family 2 protein [Chryseobacterium sp. PTM-20240506]|uniref:glycosyltransferase family 2 protein n=1 Tax=unclassified Chryseobacterium TaxID=2593645 RepID=UPI0015573DEE|nr:MULTISPECIES: glycosyltransferase [unclassified Chryseobacterium]MDC8106323.1 glycosyltransferase [Chryseobacterium sp. B21-037]MDQ1804829.1 glycosyltransferase [Chryseobacterium sp. CKR4-1]WBV55542.1 glycosyltransferase [Chryseobacterium daecheongense]